MTAICSGGTSESKAGFGASVAMGIPAIAALLNNIPTPWAVGLAAYIGILNYDLTTFCADDPPAVPTITAADVAALLSVSSESHLIALHKFADLVGAYSWYTFCKCSSVTTPAPPTAPTAPTGLPDFNPPIGAPPPAAPCWDKLAVGLTGGSVTLAHNCTLLVAPPGASHAQGNSGVDGLIYAIPVPLPTTLEMVCSVDASPASQQVFFFFQFFTSTGAQLASGSVSLLSGQTSTVTAVVPSNAVYWEFATAWTNAAYSVKANMEVRYWCAGQSPTATLAPCCPPDEIASGLLDQILQYVTLLQRQMVPFAYIDGATHTGLTGAGTEAIQGLLGVRVNFTNLPTSLGRAGEDPEVIFDAGWIAIGDSSGWFEKVRIRTSPFQWLPRQMSTATLLGYELEGSVEVTLTELEREA